jgi:hypothetical protein
MAPASVVLSIKQRRSAAGNIARSAIKGRASLAYIGILHHSSLLGGRYCHRVLAVGDTTMRAAPSSDASDTLVIVSLGMKDDGLEDPTHSRARASSVRDIGREIIVDDRR